MWSKVDILRTCTGSVILPPAAKGLIRCIPVAAGQMLEDRVYMCVQFIFLAYFNWVFLGPVSCS